MIKRRNHRPNWQEVISKPNLVLVLLIIFAVVIILNIITNIRNNRAVPVAETIVDNSKIEGIDILLSATPNPNPSPKPELTAEQIAERNQIIKEEVAKVVEKMKQEERDKELQRLSNPKIVATELSKIGKLLAYESKVDYTDTITENSFWGHKTVNIDLTFRFGISFELNELKVADIVEDMIVIQIPLDSAKLEYIEVVDEVVLNGEKTWLERHFTPDEVSVIMVNAQKTTTKRIENTDQIFNEAVRQLKDILTELIQKLGYSRVVFETI